MKLYLNQTKINFESIDTELPKPLEKLIVAGFRTEQGCILLKYFQYFGPGELDTDFKKCEYENLLNDIHIDDYFKCIDSELEYLLLGLKLAKRLHKELNTRFVGNFKIIVSFCETTYSGKEIDVFGGCVVKFHKIRPSADEYYNFLNLDRFESDAVMVIE